MSQTTRIVRTLAATLALLGAGLTLPTIPAAAQATPTSQTTTGTTAKIANALTAAPEEIARDAAVKDWPARESGPFVTLREGRNGWTCLPDDPATRGSDPMCLDAVWVGALEAFVAGRTPTVARVGYAYMLSSDAEGSNTDPTAKGPTPGNQWHHVGPHVMVIYPDPKLLDGLPTTPRADGPYVMFPGTPLAHVMLPTQSGYARPTAGGTAHARQ